MNCTPLVISTKTLGPAVSGPNAQIFSQSVFSHPNSSLNLLFLSLGSSFGPRSPFSISSGKPSYKGCALTYNLLCLFGDLAKHI